MKDVIGKTFVAVRLLMMKNIGATSFTSHLTELPIACLKSDLQSVS